MREKKFKNLSLERIVVLILFLINLIIAIPGFYSMFKKSDEDIQANVGDCFLKLDSKDMIKITMQSRNRSWSQTTTTYEYVDMVATNELKNEYWTKVECKGFKND